MKINSLIVSVLLVGAGQATQAQDLDRCLAPIPLPTVKMVTAAWAEALAGRDGTKTIPVPSHPCITHNEVRPADSAAVIGCDTRGTRALVSAGQCADQTASYPEDATIPCGASVLDLASKKFVAFIPSHPSTGASQGFAGGAVVNAWKGGLELRHGDRYEKTQSVKGARLIGAMPDGQTVLLGIAGEKGERLAAIAPGDEAPRLLSSATQQIDRADPIAGTSLVRAQLTDETGPGRLLIAEPATGKQLFEVSGAERHSLSPDAARLFAVVDVIDVGAPPKFAYELRTPDGKTARVASSLTYTSALGFDVSWKSGRAAVGTKTSVELLSLAPLKITQTLHPFGEAADAPELQRLQFSPGGNILLAYGVHTSADYKLRHVVVLFDAATGKVLKQLEMVLPDTTERSPELVVHVGDRVQRVTETGELEDFTLPPYPTDACSEAAAQLLPKIAIEVRGITLPNPATTR